MNETFLWIITAIVFLLYSWIVYCIGFHYGMYKGADIAHGVWKKYLENKQAEWLKNLL